MTETENMSEMIRREVQSINSLEERVAFKELMEGVFLALYETNRDMYLKLETRVIDDLAYNINRYRLRTGLIEKAYWDESHHLMTAICEEDTKTMNCKISDIREGFEKSGKFRLATVFLQGDTLEINRMIQKAETYEGILRTDKEHLITTHLEKSGRYLDKIENLYHLFMKNGIPWKTVNAPYLFKMMDVVITKLPGESDNEEEVKGFAVDFGQYKQMIRYDMIPLWNVWHLNLESAGFPVACMDHENYEHKISIRDYGTEHAYLVGDKAGIHNVRQSGECLLVTGQIANAKKWDIYMIRSGEDHKIDRYTYPVMENLRKDGFAERFQNRNSQLVKTKGELERFIRGFGLEDYIEYQNCALEEYGEDISETYSMNFFLKDEIRDRKGRRYLTLYFAAKGSEVWLLRDIASFIVSEVQELYPEYQCRGKLI